MLEKEEATLSSIEAGSHGGAGPEQKNEERLASNRRDVVRALSFFKQALESETGVAREDVPLDDLLRKANLISKSTILIILDQFEEYFLYNPVDEDGGRFDAEFARAVNRQDVDVNFLLALREDGLSKLDRFQGRIVNLLGNMLRLESLDLAAAEDAIRKPLELFNHEQPDHVGPRTIEDSLVDKLLDEVKTGRVILNQAGQGQGAVQGWGLSSDTRIETPFLQMVLTRMWEEEVGRGSDRLQVATLDELGGAGNIVRTYLDEVMTNLAETDGGYPDLAASLFGFLVTPSGMKIAHSARDLASMLESPEERVSLVLETLVSSRILRAAEVPSDLKYDTRYEIFHDVLAPAILDWRNRYVKDQRLIQAERIAQEEHDRAIREARNASRLRLLAIALALVSLIAVSSTVYAFTKQSEAQSNRRAAEGAQQRSEEERRKAEEAKRDAIVARGEAEEAGREAVTEREKAEKEKGEADIARRNAEQESQRSLELSLLAKISKLQAEEAEGHAELQQTIGRLYQDALENYRGGNTLEAINQYKEILPIYRKINDVSGEASTLRAIGGTYFDRYRAALGEFPPAARERIPTTAMNEITESLQYYKDALLLYQNKIAERDKEADVLKSIGRIHLGLFEDEQALGSFDQALTIYRQTDDISKEVNTLNELAGYFLNRPHMGNQMEKAESDREQARKYFNQGALRSHQKGQTAAEGFFLYKLGEMSIQSRDEAEGYPLLKQGIELYEKAGQFDNALSIIVNVCQRYGQYCERRNSCERWKELYEKALQLAIRTNNHSADSQMLQQLARIYESFGDKAKALELYEESIRSVKDSRLVSPYLSMTLYRLSYELKDYQKAKGYLEQLEAFTAKGFNPPLTLRVYEGYGDIFYATKELDKALEKYNQALEFLSSINSSDMDKVYFLKKLADVYESMGQKDKALEYRQKAKSLEDKARQSSGDVFRRDQ